MKLRISFVVIVFLSITLTAVAQQSGNPAGPSPVVPPPFDATGHYSVQLGVTKPSGVPTALFTKGEARWLGVQVAGQPEQPRVLLVSVPYALKAGDAATLGGLPPSAFLLAARANADSSAPSPAAFHLRQARSRERAQ